jgi:hypothetical protein
VRNPREITIPTGSISLSGVFTFIYGMVLEKFSSETKRAGAGDENGSPPHTQPLRNWQDTAATA